MIFAENSRIEQNSSLSKLKLKPKFKVYKRGLDTQRARVAGPEGFEPSISGFQHRNHRTTAPQASVLIQPRLRALLPGLQAFSALGVKV